jgi:hypothetical protein
MKSPDPEKQTAGDGGVRGQRRPEERVKDAGREAADAARAEAETAANRGKHQASAAAGRTADALEQTATNLSEQGQQTLADVTSMLSQRLSTLAHDLETRSIDDLTQQARRLARENPGLFMAGGVAVGMALSRFFKASGDSVTGTGPAYGSEAAVPPEARAGSGPQPPAATSATRGAESGAASTMGGHHD